MFMSKSPIRWLHISDFHIKTGDTYDHDVVVEALLSSLPNLIERFGQPDFVIASGDIAFSGKKAEYDLATQLFDAVLNILSLKRERLFVVPGNHDVDRTKGMGLRRVVS